MSQFAIVLVLAVLLQPLYATKVPIGQVSIRTSYYRGWGSYLIEGWACVPGVYSNNVQVEIHLGNHILGTIKTNRFSTWAVIKTCEIGFRHNFSYQLHWKQSRTFRNKQVKAFGIYGSAKKQLTNSGKLHIPKAPPTDIRGNIEGGPSVWSSGYKLTGWACQTGDRKSVDVNVYLGASAWEGGKFLKRVKANLPGEHRIGSSMCETPGFSRYRFEIPISSKDFRRHKGKKVFVHGVSTKKTGNAYIFNSGYVQIPVISRSSIRRRCIPIFYSARISVGTWPIATGCSRHDMSRVSDILATYMSLYFELIGLKRAKTNVCPARRRHLAEVNHDDSNWDSHNEINFIDRANIEDIHDGVNTLDFDTALSEDKDTMIDELPLENFTDFGAITDHYHDFSYDTPDNRNIDASDLHLLEEDYKLASDHLDSSDLESFGGILNVRSDEEGEEETDSMETYSPSESEDHHRELAKFRFFYGGGRCYLCSNDNLDHRRERRLVTLYGMDQDFDTWKKAAERDMAKYLEEPLRHHLGNDLNHCYHRVWWFYITVELEQESSWSDANRCPG